MKEARRNVFVSCRGEILMAKYVLCPRCELNYMQDGEQYCDVCKAELKMGPQLIFTEDEDEASGEKLCPVCKRNLIGEDEEMCEQCREEHKYDNEPDSVDLDSDDEWRNYLDDDEKDLPDDEDGVISFSQLADEEKSDELFKDDDEEEEEEEYVDDEPDDFDVEIDEKDFEGDEDEIPDDDDEDDDDDDF